MRIVAFQATESILPFLLLSFTGITSFFPSGAHTAAQRRSSVDSAPRPDTTDSSRAAVAFTASWGRLGR